MRGACSCYYYYSDDSLWGENLGNWLCSRLVYWERRKEKLGSKKEENPEKKKRSVP